MTFQRITPEEHRERRAVERAANLKALASSTLRPVSAGSYSGGTTGQSIDKEVIVRSEPYRRLVAALPCAACRIEGFSQAAHPPPTAKGRKETDLDCFPLCSTRPGVLGCHAEFDRYMLIPAAAMREQAARWADQTRRKIKRAGLWPANLEQPKGTP